jgi:hypothetical protein
LTRHLGNPIPSAAIFDKVAAAFRKSVARFAEDNHIPVVRFCKTDRKREFMRPYLDRQARTGRPGSPAPSGRRPKRRRRCAELLLNATANRGEGVFGK